MNAMQCQVRIEIFRTAEYRGFNFDKVTVKVASDPVLLSVYARCGKLWSISHIPFEDLISDYTGRKRQRFYENVCDQIISRDAVMSADEIIYRRLQGLGIHEAKFLGEITAKTYYAIQRYRSIVYD